MKNEEIFKVWSDIYQHIFDSCPYNGKDSAGDLTKVLAQVQNAWNVPDALFLSSHGMDQWLGSIGAISSWHLDRRPAYRVPLVSPEAQTRIYRLSIPPKDRHTVKVKRDCALDKVAMFGVIFPIVTKMDIEWDCPFWRRV
jgi:hypothetical protein